MSKDGRSAERTPGSSDDANARPVRHLLLATALVIATVPLLAVGGAAATQDSNSDHCRYGAVVVSSGITIPEPCDVFSPVCEQASGCDVVGQIEISGTGVVHGRLDPVITATANGHTGCVAAGVSASCTETRKVDEIPENTAIEVNCFVGELTKADDVEVTCRAWLR